MKILNQRLCVACFTALACMAWLGCDDLSEFKTAPGEVFRGEVIGGDSESGEASFIRDGFPSHAQMELEFDPDFAQRLTAGDGGAAVSGKPGRLSTYVCPGNGPTCSHAARKRRDFDAVALLPIEHLAHDALSQYSFPGGGRVRNYIFGARFSSSAPTGAVPRYAMVFVSLMENGQIEVRVIAPSVLAPDGRTELMSPLFGVFVLGRHAA